jgi:hypothetical protein
LRSPPYTRFVKELLERGFDGTLGDALRSGDFLVAQPLTHAGEHPLLSYCQVSAETLIRPLGRHAHCSPEASVNPRRHPRPHARVGLDQRRDLDLIQVDPPFAQADEALAPVHFEVLPKICVRQQFADHQLHAAL